MEIYKSALKGISAEIGKLPEVWVVIFSFGGMSSLDDLDACCPDYWNDTAPTEILVGVFTTEEEARTVQGNSRGRKTTKMRGSEVKKFLKHVRK